MTRDQKGKIVIHPEGGKEAGSCGREKERGRAVVESEGGDRKQNKRKTRREGAEKKGRVGPSSRTTRMRRECERWKSKKQREEETETEKERMERRYDWE